MLLYLLALLGQICYDLFMISKKTLIIAFSVFLIVFLVVVFNIVRQVRTFRGHRDYFRQPIETQKIQDWMTFRFIENHYHVDVESVLHVKIPFTDLKNPISKYCTRKHLDCEKLISDFENNKK